jgi:hypothetical protein
MREPADRFHVVVLNADRLELFTRNFSRIRGFDIARDRLVVLDCSRRPASQRRILQEFAQRNGWTVGERVQFVRRRNWGIDQGARIDLLAGLHDKPQECPAFLWQFQEHFLDLDSPAARWPAGTSDLQGRPIAGEIKADSIAGDAVIDLDHCQALFDDAGVGVVHACRGGLSVMHMPGGGDWFYADGGNFGARTRTLLDSVSPRRLAAYRAAYDGTYNWALFMEMEWGRMLTATGCSWHDLAARTRVASGMAADPAGDVPLQHLATDFSGRYAQYALRVDGLCTRGALEVAALATLGQAMGVAREWARRVRRAAATVDPRSRHRTGPGKWMGK